MKKILVVFALFCTLFFAACGGGSSKIDGEDNESDKNTGELGGECYGNGTCNAGLLCNTESNTCVKDPENPNDGSDTSSEQTNNDVDTISGENDDDSHTSSENDNDSDTTQDNSDSQPDSDDGDTMNSDYSILKFSAIRIRAKMSQIQTKPALQTLMMKDI